MMKSTMYGSLKLLVLKTTTIYSLSVALLLIVGCKKSSEPNNPPGPPWIAYSAAGGQLKDDHVHAIYSAADGVVWVGTDSGLAYSTHGSWSWDIDDVSYTVYFNGGSAQVSSVTSITQSLTRSLWFGTPGGGIFRYDQFGTVFNWKRYTTSDQLPSNSITGIDQSQTPGQSQLGEVWCVTTAGVGHFVASTNQGGTWTTFNSSNSTLPSNLVYSIAYDFNDYSIWFATSLPSSITHIDGEGKWQPPTLLPNESDHVTAIAFDAANVAWLAKWTGVSSYDTKSGVWNDYTNASTSGKLPLSRVNAVTTNFSTTRWFGTNAGLVRLTDTTWTTFNRQNTSIMPTDTITAVSYDRNGNLWIGTPDGVLVYNPAGTQF